MEETTTTQPATPPTPAEQPAAPAKSGTTFESLAVAGLVFGIFAVVVAVFAVGLAARAMSESSGSGGGGGGGGGSAPATADIVLADFSLDPDTAAIQSDGTINLRNIGNVQHDLKIEDQESEMIEPGSTGELTLEGLAPGEYTMYCSVPGHKEAGMEGTITVK